ncbi:flagellar filament capping protein FliD [Tepidibacter hydrothermalis]|uniref:Flagellar hook-associated protein 2 n=1 Tax=Tepidibacter hydrothermalis TaxID=3036126 RepID=A0ABY8EDR2_9FIRM|nr:flagellar filament capping protein FliD [Tepidibacter hydrothermalis]WFD10030.1 flagellar filament capping protein FliD [Tepidibacter hydrothermalis]
MSPMRIGGLASGMDTDTMVKQLMDAEKVRLNKYNQQKQTKLWTQEAYNDVNKDFANFIIDTKKDLDIGISGTVSGASWLKSASSSDEDIFKVSARAGAVEGNHKMRVKQLAKGVNVASKSDVTNDKFDKDGSIEFKVDVDGTEKTVTVNYTKDDTPDTLATKINSAVNKDGDSLGLKASYDLGSKRFFLSTEKTGEKSQIKVTSDSGNIINGKLNLGMEDRLKINKDGSVESNKALKNETLGDLIPDSYWDADGKYKFTIGGNDITLLKTDKLDALEAEINKIDGLAVTYDETKAEGDIFKIEASKNIDLKIEDEAGFLKSNLGLSGVENNLKGQDAIIDFDGAEDITYSSNQFTINGISIDLKSDPENDIKEYNISVDTDVDAVYDKIKGFVDKYNELIDKLNKKTSEKVYRDYKPLTAEEKKAMDDKDTVKLWEDKAKSGLLRNDEHITRILNSTRTGLYESVYTDYTKHANKEPDNGKLTGYSHISQVGITTGKYQDKGKLKIDEDKLKEAIQNDVDGVMDLFFSKSDITESSINSASSSDEKNNLRAEKRAETGLITRLFDDITDGMKGIIDKSGTGENSDLYRKVKSNILIDFVTKSGSKSLLDKDLMNLEKQIISENSRLAKKESAYYKKYAAMETAMNKMNSQSSWLASQLG